MPVPDGARAKPPWQALPEGFLFMIDFSEQNEKPLRLLLVDDDVAVRRLMYAVFESGGYDVLAAGSGLEGLAIFRRSSHPVDMLVTDFNMPGMTGLELARACWRFHPGMVALFVSGRDPDRELQSELKPRGAPRRCDFLAKPFHGRELLHKARRLSAPGLIADSGLGSGLRSEFTEEHKRCL